MLHSGQYVGNGSHQVLFVCLTSSDTQVLALLSRKAKQEKGQAGGQTVDVSIFERYGLRRMESASKLTRRRVVV